MTEWQILESDEFPELAVEEVPQSKRRRPWLWFGLGTAAVLIAGMLFSLNLKRNERQSVIRADLEAAIFEEETQRFLGQPSAALSIPNASRAWQAAYQQTFSAAPTSLPDTVKITELDFDGGCALVRLELTSESQIRAYCLSETGWLRAPVSATMWGEHQEPIELGYGVALHFRQRDQAFAEALATDLSALIDSFIRRKIWPEQVLESVPSWPLKISITPQDLSRPLRVDATKLIRVNSPWLTPRQADTGLAGQAAVRLAVGEALMRQAILPPMQEDLLPGSARFTAAGQTVLAMQELLTPAMQAELLNTWRRQLGDGFISPFLAERSYYVSAASEEEIRLSTQITAYYLATLNGPDIFYEMLQQLPETRSWDQLFQTNLDRLTRRIEQEAAAFAGGDEIDPALSPISPPADLPLVGRISDLHSLSSDRTRAYLSRPNREDRQVVDIPAGLDVRTEKGERLSLDCAAGVGQLTISGQWLESPHRLEAHEITVKHSDLDVGPAPADTVAYLSSRADGGFSEFVALDRQGDIHPLGVMRPGTTIVPLPGTADQRPQFLYAVEQSGCERVWFGHYKPREGTRRWWLSPPSLAQWVWRPNHQDLIYLSNEAGITSYDIYRSSPDLLPELIGHSDIPQTVLGWNLERDQLVTNIRQLDQYHLALFNLTSGDMVSRAYYLPLWGRILSPDGEWLAYLSSSISSPDATNRLELLNMLDGSPRTMAVFSVREGFLSPVWSPYPGTSKLAALAGPIRDKYPVPTRLIVATPDQQPHDYTLVAQALPGELFASPVFCADGALLYRSELDGGYRLMRQMPGGEAEILFRSTEPFRPLACP